MRTERRFLCSVSTVQAVHKTADAKQHQGALPQTKYVVVESRNSVTRAAACAWVKAHGGEVQTAVELKAKKGKPAAKTAAFKIGVDGAQVKDVLAGSGDDGFFRQAVLHQRVGTGWRPGDAATEHSEPGDGAEPGHRAERASGAAVAGRTRRRGSGRHHTGAGQQGVGRAGKTNLWAEMWVVDGLPLSLSKNGVRAILSEQHAWEPELVRTGKHGTHRVLLVRGAPPGTLKPVVVGGGRADLPSVRPYQRRVAV